MLSNAYQSAPRPDPPLLRPCGASGNPLDTFTDREHSLESALQKLHQQMPPVPASHRGNGRLLKPCMYSDTCLQSGSTHGGPRLTRCVFAPAQRGRRSDGRAQHADRVGEQGRRPTLRRAVVPAARVQRPSVRAESERPGRIAVHRQRHSDRRARRGVSRSARRRRDPRWRTVGRRS